MPVISGGQTALAANTTTANLVAGQMHEFLKRPAAVTLAACGSAVGLQATLIIGERTIVNDQPISAANRFPILPDDILAQDVGRSGERIILTFRNTTAGALNHFFSLTIEYA